MATFTSVTTGDWDDGATWGNTSPGVKGTDWPGLAGDVVNISNGDTVTYNVSETNQLGIVTIDAGGILTFDPTMDTLLSIGNVDFIVEGSLIVGTEATPIDAAYTAKILHYSTSSGNELNASACEEVSICGDPDVYGSITEGILYSTWSSGQTFTVTGDLTSLWTSGSTLALFVDGEYSSYLTDIQLVTIDTIVANGDNTDITINEANPGYTFSAGAYVFNQERNVIYSSNGTETFTIGGNDSSCGRIRILAPVDDRSLIDSAIICWNYETVLYNVNLNNNIIHHIYQGATIFNSIGENNYLYYPYSYGDFKNCIFSNFNFITPIVTYQGNFIKCNIDKLRVINSYVNFGSASSYYRDSNIFFEIFKCRSSVSIAPFAFGVYEGENNFSAYLGQNANGLSYWVNDYLFYTGTVSSREILLKNLYTPTSDITVYHYNTSDVDDLWQIFVEAWDGDRTDPRMYGSHSNMLMVDADGTGVEPSQRSGGHDRNWKITTYSNIREYNLQKVPIEFNYFVNASDSLTFNIYMQTNYAASFNYRMVLAHNDDFGYDIGTITTRSSQSDWSQYSSISKTFTSDGWANIKLYIWGYEASNYIWVDPLIEVV